MKKKKIILIITIFIILFCIINRLFIPKYSESLIEGHMIGEYYKSPKNHDVIFVGDCEVYANISPMVIYEETGIKSYVRGTPQQLIWQSYYIIKETLKYETPQVIVLNINSMRYSEPVSEAYNHLTIDNMKWSKEKYNMINASMTKEENIWFYIFPILRYHSRYSELSKEDIKYFFKSKDQTYNGFLINKNIKPVGSLPTKKELGNYNFSDNNYKYLQDIVDLCKNNNIKLLLIKSPSLYPYWYEEYDTQIKQFANKNNIDYIDFTKLANIIGIDYETDTYDGGLHLNLYGATKYSKYIARLLKKGYNINTYESSYYNKLLNEYKETIKE